MSEYKQDKARAWFDVVRTIIQQSLHVVVPKLNQQFLRILVMHVLWECEMAVYVPLFFEFFIGPILYPILHAGVSIDDVSVS